MPTSPATTAPILTINVGYSYISFLLFQEGQDFKSFIYPYVYSKSLFKHLISEDKFYNEALKIAAKNFKVAVKDCVILVSGFPQAPSFGTEVKLVSSLEKSLAVFTHYSCFYVGYFKLLNSNEFMYSCPMIEQVGSNFAASAADKLNDESNACIFPQVTSLDDLHRYDVDSISRFHRTQLSISKSVTLPILFTGHSFYNTLNKPPYLSYMLAIDLVADIGTHELKIDEFNIVPNLGLLGLYDTNLFTSISDYKLTSLGTLLNAPGKTECLFESDYGTSQLVDIEKEKLFFIPLEEGATARIVVKNSILGTVEKTITGGKLGFIIDTRDKNNPQMLNHEYVEKNYAPWFSSIKEVLEGLYVPTSN